MGGRIGFAIARYAPERVNSRIIGGGSPYPHSQAGPDRMIEAPKHGAEAIPSIWGVPVPPAVRARLVKNDADDSLPYQGASKRRLMLRSCRP